MSLKYYLLLLFLACAITTAAILSMTGSMISISLTPMFIIVSAACFSALTFLWKAWDSIWGNQAPSQNNDSSTEMQDALLKIRGLEAELISIQAQLDTAQSKEKTLELKIKQSDTATTLSKTAAEMSHTSIVLKAANEASDNSHTTSKIIIENQIIPLQHELNALKHTIQSLTIELEEKKALINAFQPQLIAQQTEIDLHKNALTEISTKMIELTNLSQHQEKTIEILSKDNEQLANTVEALTNALEETMSQDTPCTHQPNMETTTKTSVSFF